MRVPSIHCNIQVISSVNPSEDPEKVKKAVLNILPDLMMTSEEFSIVAQSHDLSSLEKIRESIHSKQSQRTYRRTLEKNLKNDKTWFYLNKQAAFAEKIAICEESDESPLGPIKIILSSPNVEVLIDWIASVSDDFS